MNQLKDLFCGFLEYFKNSEWPVLKISSFIAVFTFLVPTGKWQALMVGSWCFIFLFCLKSLISPFLSPSLIDASLKEVVERQFLSSGIYWGNTRRSHVENIIDFIHQCQTKMNGTMQKPIQNADGGESLTEHEKSSLLLFFLLVLLLVVLFFH